jgi:hypothetical protein
MAALTQDRITKKKFAFDGEPLPVKAATKIYAGAKVAVDANGFAVPASDTAALRVMGVAKATVDNTAGADGALIVNVLNGLFLFDATSITQAMLGQVMYVVDDHTFDDVAGTNGVKAGRLVSFVSTTSGWLLVQPTAVGSVVADADATYGQPEADLINNLKLILNKWVL